MNYVAKLGRGFPSPPGPAASMDVVTNYLHTAWLWEKIRVQVSVREGGVRALSWGGVEAVGGRPERWAVAGLVAGGGGGGGGGLM